MNHPIDGSSRDPVWSEAAATWAGGGRVSAVAVTAAAAGPHTVAFLGTVDGQLIKVACPVSRFHFLALLLFISLTATCLVSGR